MSLEGSYYLKEAAKLDRPAACGGRGLAVTVAVRHVGVSSYVEDGGEAAVGRCEALERMAPWKGRATWWEVGGHGLASRLVRCAGTG